MKIALVCSHGGHLTETLQLLPAFEGHQILFATYHSVRDKDVLAIAPAHFTQNIGTNPFRMLIVLFWSLGILLRERPQVVLSLGAEIALPFFFWAKILRINTVFIESWCRVKTLSGTGKLLYPLADVFFVQWPELAQVAGPKARYEGAVL